MLQGRLFVLGLGPGDPDLMTVKAARMIAAAPVVAFFAKQGRKGHARSMVDGQMRHDVEELRLEYPFTTEVAVEDPRYLTGMNEFYEVCAERLRAPLQTGRDVTLLCEGDPFLYGSAMYLFDRLRTECHAEIVPGVPGMSGCWSRANLPMTHGDDVLSVLPGTLDEESLLACLKLCDAAVLIKVGRNLPKICRVLRAAGLFERAVYVERGTMAGEHIVKLAEREDGPAPYFSMVLVPGRRYAR
ncbi:precorrin-2 C(20)-methyltransferase [Acidocella sp.]|uniref:precorrin-2 C(20)-methyltransferase n=1 Tax=Acidocella sp. TaxID=50710 RepID=UPI0018117E70|nr:precorrin-2 C(20)-methyltransferase [Acidocella sp.]NNM57592.1 precorrin-2 C(20)-methyltransferase [Acidocella sp.]